MRTLTWALVAALAVGGVLALPLLPARVPVHWAADGSPDGWGPPWVLALYPSVVAALLATFVRRLARRDPRGPVSEADLTRIDRLVLGIVALLAVVEGVTIAAALGLAVDVARTVLVSVGLLFAWIGAAMRDLGPNSYAGIRTPWTLRSEAVWRAVHERHGPVWTAGGLALAALAVVAPASWSVPMLLGCVLALVGAPVVDSWRLARTAP